MTKTGQSVRFLVYIAAMTAVLEVSKFLLNSIPNVELITVLFIVFTERFTWKMTLPAAVIFALVECIWWGFGTWSAVYFYIWPLLILLTEILPSGTLQRAVLAAAYGLGFGALCAIVSLIVGGPSAALAWWVAGIPYDLIHCVSNFLTCLLLYRPLTNALSYIKL